MTDVARPGAYSLRVAFALALAVSIAPRSTAHADDSLLTRHVRRSETFADAVAAPSPVLAVELALGLAYEGTVAADLGWLVPWVPGLEVHASVGLVLEPALRLALSIRYVAPLGAFRPYLAAGFIYGDAFSIGSRTDELAIEVGHRFMLGQFTFVHIGAGARVVVHAWLDQSSPLLDGTLAAASVGEALDALDGSVAPIVAIRFTRVF